jgi:hypothetical protein
MPVTAAEQLQTVFAANATVGVNTAAVWAIGYNSCNGSTCFKSIGGSNSTQLSNGHIESHTYHHLKLRCSQLFVS